MARILIGAAVAFCLPVLTCGQEQTSSAQTPVPAGNLSAPPAANVDSSASLSDASDDKLVLKDGQAIVLRSTRRLSSETAKAGEKVQFEVIKPVTIGDLIVIPEHAVAAGRIVTAEKKKRRLHSGKLTVAIEHVAVVTGQDAPLRSTESRAVESWDYSQPSGAGSGDPLAAGAILFAAPAIILLAHGSAKEIPLAARVTAYLDGDLVLDRDTVQKAQASLPEPRPEGGTVYIYRDTTYHDQDCLRPERDYPNNYKVITCGEVRLGAFHPGQFVRLQLPHGLYWMQAGVPLAVRTVVDKRYLDSKHKHFFALNVEEGNSYYLRLAGQTRRRRLDTYVETYLEQVDRSVGADAVFAAYRGRTLDWKTLLQKSSRIYRCSPKKNLAQASDLRTSYHKVQSAHFSGKRGAFDRSMQHHLM